ncbi:NAD-dependent epimerase/dehydratase family protein [Cryptosporangium phraense]|uniref:NAD-dependent epimerase/dehydratase family protein n=1 Tax=Cryptosporangium phraense TaxID=2593070 RepID=A0A545AKI3_9ACTN|nr:NAD-dependent epimerase/dehydratase family protein [Cryptosporangium phraense]TQS41818.1 NAD-dependent epimerase/dehydratase family protein [Cryptosporangium phraense]
MSPTVVVTGAAGFIGSHLVDRLLAADFAVIGVDLRAVHGDIRAQFNLTAAVNHHRYRAVQADLAMIDLDALLDGVDCVFHLAAVPGVRRSWGTGFPDYVRVNVLVTDALLAACARAGVRRLVYASSSSVYGHAVSPSREAHATLPLSPYGVTKLAGEQLCFAHALRGDSRLSTVALRYFTVYGPRQRPDMAISRMIMAALTGIPYTVFGDGQQRREFTYVDDVVDATVAAATADATAVAINVGGGTSVSVSQALHLVEEVTGRDVPLHRSGEQAGDAPITVADLDTARRLLGYQPRTDLRAGIAQHADWLRSLPAPAFQEFLPPVPAASEVPA